MGVHGLWQLLQLTGRPANLDSLEGQVLAVDVSIWIYQMITGNPLPNAHIINMFQRICKLLYFKIKPVFVFDGAVPPLKTATVAQRKKRKSKHGEDGERLRRAVLSNYLKQHALGKILKDKNVKPVKISRIQPETTFMLPPQPQSSDWVEDVSDDDGWSFSKTPVDATSAENVDDIDIESEHFKSLPFQIQHGLLTHIKAVKKRNSLIRTYHMPENMDDFSAFQLNKLFKVSQITRRIDDVSKSLAREEVFELGINADLTDVEILRIASENKQHSVLIKGSSSQLIADGSRLPVSTTSASGSSLAVSSLASTSTGTNDCQSQTFITPNHQFYSHSSFSPQPLWNDDEADVEDDVGDCVDELVDGSVVEDIKNIDSRGSVVCVAVDSTEVGNETLNLNRSSCTSDDGDTSNDDDFIDVSERSSHDDVMDYKPDQSSVSEAEVINYKAFQRSPASEGVPSPNSLPDSSSDQVSDVAVDHTRSNLVQHSSESGTYYFSRLVRNKISHLNSSDEESRSTGPVKEIIDVQLGEGVVSDTSSKPMESISTGVPFSNPMESISTGVSVSNPMESISTGVSVSNPMESISNGVPVSNPMESISTGVSVSNPMESISTGVSVSNPMESISTGVPVSNRVESISTGVSVSNPMETISTGVPVGKYNSDVSQFTDANNPFSGYLATSPSKPTNVSGGVPSSSDIVSEDSDSDGDNLAGLRAVFDAEGRSLAALRDRSTRLAASPTEQMVSDCKQLCKLFGIPYIVSPYEAESQCAYLELTNQTQGTITNDSDIWLFGGRKVYKNFFAQSKTPEYYSSEVIDCRLRLNRERLICLAYLLGSDYTLGVEGVGVVSAMELLSEFPGDGIEMLIGLKDWWTKNKGSQLTKCSPIKRRCKSLDLAPGFPDPKVADAYLRPEVDESDVIMRWGTPDVEGIQGFAARRLGWDAGKVDQTLGPVLARGASSLVQTTMGRFVGVASYDEPKVSSKRLQRVLSRMRDSTGHKAYVIETSVRECVASGSGCTIPNDCGAETMKEINDDVDWEEFFEEPLEWDTANPVVSTGKTVGTESKSNSLTNELRNRFYSRDDTVSISKPLSSLRVPLASVTEVTRTLRGRQSRKRKPPNRKPKCGKSRALVVDLSESSSD